MVLDNEKHNGKIFLKVNQQQYSKIQLRKQLENMSKGHNNGRWEKG